MVPFCSTITNWLLKRTDINTVSCPPLKIKHMMRSVKDLLGRNVPDIYKIPCSCSLSYIGQTGGNVAISEKEHKRHLRLGIVDKSALVDTGHIIWFAETVVLHKSSKWGERIIRESLEILLAYKVINKEDGLRLSMAWFLAYQLIKQVLPAEGNAACK